MRFLVTGATGQVGAAFVEVAGARHEVVPATRADMPLEDARAIDRAVRAARPDWVVHCAAMTNVDACEADPTAAREANVEGARRVARSAAAAGARLLHVSTDYVFDGKAGPYREEDPTGPVNVYAHTKLEGERAALSEAPDAVVARTCVVFGPHRPNFVTWVLGELTAGRRVRVLTDQLVNPTYSSDGAAQMLALAEHDAEGVFHTAGATGLSRHAMAVGVARTFGLDASLAQPARMADLPWKAPRPHDTRLDVSKSAKFHAPMAYPDALEALRARLAGRLP